MSLPLLFVFSFAVGFGAVVTPGPVSTAIVSESAKRGFIVGPLVTVGHMFTELILVLLIALGLSAGLNTLTVVTIISVVGGAFLLWVGGEMLWNVFKGRTTLPKPGTDLHVTGNGQLVALGVVTTLLNPFWYVWWVTVGAAYIVIAQTLGWIGVVVFFLGHITGDYLWNSILSGVVGGGRKWFTDSIYKWIIVGCGLYLIVLGITFLLTPFR